MSTAFLNSVPGGDLNGLAVEPINVFSKGLIAPLDDCLEGGLSLRVPTRCSEDADELVLQIPLRGDQPGG